MEPEFRDKVKLMITKYGVGHTTKMFDNSIDVIRRVYQDNPLDFLNQFNDLTPFELEGKIFYMDKKGKPLFYYQDKENGYISISNDRIWLFFSVVIGLNYDEIQDVMKTWLGEVYNLRRLTPNMASMIQ